MYEFVGSSSPFIKVANLPGPTDAKPMEVSHPAHAQVRALRSLYAGIHARPYDATADCAVPSPRYVQNNKNRFQMEAFRLPANGTVATGKTLLGFGSSALECSCFSLST